MKKEYLISYETDASQIKEIPKEVFTPESVEELTKIILENKKITPRGGGTGLVGGAVARNSIIIDMSKLNKITSFDKNKKIIEVESGIILDDLNNYLDEFNLEFPVNPSSHAVCTIGGMIATNAVGSRAVKYEKTSDWVESLETSQKNSDIENFAGMEGTTGIIIKARLKLIEKKKRTATLITKKDFREIIIELNKLNKKNISMAEFIGKQASEFIGLKNYNLIIEYESDEGELKSKEYFELLKLRDKLYPILAKEGYQIIEDPFIDSENIIKLIEFLEQKQIPYFGHLGSGILHPCFKKEQKQEIIEMMNLVKKLGGKITGEHGIGLLKKDFLSEEDKEKFTKIKSLQDPENKFNSGKII